MSENRNAETTAADCPHLSWTGDEGPVAELGRMPRRWKCDSCGFVREDPEFDPWTDYDTVYAQFTRPHRGGTLSPRGRHDPKIGRDRLRADANAILWQLHWAVRDLVSARAWGQKEAAEATRLRHRLTEVFGLLTDEQRAEMLRRDEARRAR